MFEVYQKRCDECLFSKNKIVSDARKDQLLKTIAKKDNFFICHKSSLVGGDICCRGFYDKHGKDSRVIRMAKAFDVVRFIKLPRNKKKVVRSP